MRGPGRFEDGSVIILSMSLIFLLGAIGSTALMRSLQEHRLGDRSAARQQAFFLAEGGLDQALRNLQTPNDALDDVTAGTLSTGTFSIDAPVSLGGPLQWQVTAHGTSGSETRRIEGTVQLTPESVFQFALFGAQQVSVTGNAQTDSYDSDLGPYDENLHEHHGDVGTNATTAGGINVSGSIFIDGQVAVGADVEDPLSVVSSSCTPMPSCVQAYITGGTSPPSDTQDVVAQSQTFPMPPVVVPDGLVCSDFTVQGNTTVTLSPTGGPLGNGTYCYHNLVVQGNADLTATGPVTIYVVGQLTAQGNSVIGVVGDPTQMLFQMTSTADATLEQTIQGNNTLYGAIYGPDATVTIQGNAEIFGSVIAGQIDVTGNAEMHYDERMAEVTEVSNRYETSLVSWREVAGP